jgi:hypothetical protein
MGPFLKKIKINFFHMGGQTKGGLGGEFFSFEKKGPMGVVEGCLGYWCRDGSYNGYFC